VLPSANSDPVSLGMPDSTRFMVQMDTDQMGSRKGQALARQVGPLPCSCSSGIFAQDIAPSTLTPPATAVNLLNPGFQKSSVATTLSPHSLTRSEGIHGPIVLECFGDD
jgi:hypothetical protein